MATEGEYILVSPPRRPSYPGIYSYHHFHNGLLPQAYLFVDKERHAPLFASKLYSNEWVRSNWQYDTRDTRYLEDHNGNIRWIKFCWGGKEAERVGYPSRTLIVKELLRKVYIALEGPKQRPWAVLVKLEELSPEWIVAFKILGTAKEVDAQWFAPWFA